jgi:autophagy-related protein 2
VGFSLQSLHLTFCLLPTTANDSLQSDANLADSVASIAESFLHDELSPREKLTLHKSFHPDLASSVSSHADDESNVPGSIDPFLSADDEEYHLDDDDPVGVSIFASLFERLLSRFEFDAADIKLTFIHPGNASFSISIPEIRYSREMADNTGSNTSGDSRPSPGATGTVSISGITMTTRSLRSRIHLPPTPLAPSTLSPVSPTILSNTFVPPPRSTSPASSSSSMNEDTQFLMSQSLACLPPRQPSPPSSIASSLYQSAISAAPMPVDKSRRTPPPGGRDQVEMNLPDNTLSGSSRNVVPEGQTATRRNSEPLEETIVSFGAESVIIRLTTPLVSFLQTIPSEPNSSSPSSHGDKPRVKANEKLHVSLTTGVLSCALHAWHVRSLLDVLDALASHRVPQAPVLTPDVKSLQATSDPSIPMLGPGIEGSVKVCGIVLILWSWDQGDSISQTSTPSPNDSLSNFFAHPLVPPQLSHGYVRVHVDGLSLSLNMSASVPVTSTTLQGKPAGVRTQSRTHSTASSTTALVLSLTDISIVAIHALPSPSEPTVLRASPILITDPLLPSQYSPTHLHPDVAAFISEETSPYAYPQLPTFEVTDWTDERHKRNGMRISMWRSRIKPKPGRRGSGDGQSKARSQADLQTKSPREVDQHSELPFSRASSAPAIILSTETVKTSSITGKKNGDTFTQRIDLKTVPLHVFVDLGLALKPGGLLVFLDPIIGSGGKENITGERIGRDEESSSESTGEESHTPPASPGVVRTREREKERRRLERLVLKDLDLDYDYRKKEPSKISRKSKSQVVC